MRNLSGTIVLAAALAGLWHTPLAASPVHHMAAAKGPYFACDRRVAEDRWQADRFVVPPRRHAGNPLVVRSQPWEGTGPLMGGSVLYDPEDRLFRMWYCVWNSHAYYNKLPFSYNVCYAESDDGITWTKPSLGVFDHQGSTDNNCIRLGTDKTQNIDVCLNPRPDRFPGKFLAIHNQKGGVFVSSSADGKMFDMVFRTPAIPYHSDTHNNFVYDDSRDRWLLFCRPRAYAGDHKRRVSLQESTDLETWTHDRTVLVPSETEQPEFYGMPVFRRGDLFFGLLQVYDRSQGTMHVELAWSGDGVHWEQVATHPPFFSRGEPGAWDASMVLVAESPVVVDDEMRFYYGGFPLPHDEAAENVAAVGMAVAERDRLAGIRPRGDEPGFLLTRSFLRPERSTLLVNCVVRGTLSAELRNDDGKPLPGFTFDDCDAVSESGFAQSLTWQGRTLGAVPVPEIRILFRLDNTDLFTFDFAPAP